MVQASTLDLRAELVDAAIAMDQTLRPGSESRFRSPARHRDDHFDWVSRGARWDHHPAWQDTGEIANNFLHGQINKAHDGRFHRDVDADAMDEELLDELFAQGEDLHPVFRANGRW